MAQYTPARSVLGMEPAEVDAILAEGATLPAAFYTSPEIARIEDERVWRRAWQPVGVEPELRRVGDYFTDHVRGTFFDVPVVVVRDEGMALRAFINVCRHRAHFVATGTGNRKTLQCSYHGWTYGLNGCLRSVPRQAEGGLPPFETLGLYPLPCETWMGYIFVAVDPQETLAEALGELPAVMDRNGFVFPFAPENVDPDHEYVRQETDLALGRSRCNWKTMNENNVECYHCPTTHTHSFAELYDVDPDRYSAHQFDRGIYNLYETKRWLADRLGMTNSGGPLPDRQFYWFWPNIYFQQEVMPRPTTGFARLVPDGVDASVVGGASYRLPESQRAPTDPELEAEIEMYWRQTIAEDYEVTARVQAGLDSGMYEWGYTLPESEATMRHFYRLTWEALKPAFT